MRTEAHTRIPPGSTGLRRPNEPYPASVPVLSGRMNSRTPSCGQRCAGVVSEAGQGHLSRMDLLFGGARQPPPQSVPRERPDLADPDPGSLRQVPGVTLERKREASAGLLTGQGDDNDLVSQRLLVLGVELCALPRQARAPRPRQLLSECGLNGLTPITELGPRVHRRDRAAEHRA